MKTQELIRNTALELFNDQGLSMITLRDIAEKLNKSYGNITYHYPNKESIIAELYKEMRGDLKQVSDKFPKDTGLLETILKAPGYTFDISIKYRFLFVDYVELIRKYPMIARTADMDNESGKKRLKKILLVLAQQGMLSSQITSKEIDYLMELSGAMRTFFFLKTDPALFSSPGIKMEYIQYINRLLFPYLSAKGRKIYNLVDVH